MPSKVKVTLLGTGTPNLDIDRWGPSTLIQAGENYLLFDCGRGTLLRIKKAKINPTLVSKVFLTHLHSDHIVGLPDLWLTGWEMGRKKPFRVWGPEGTKSMAYNLREAFRADIDGRQLSPQSLPENLANIHAEDIEEDTIDLGDNTIVTSFLVDHGSFKPALGYRVEYQGVSVVLSGDTVFTKNLVRHSMGVDVVIHNAWVASKDSPVYQLVASPEDAGKLFNLAKPKLAVISHYNTDEGLARRINQSYNGSLVIGKDLMKIEINPEEISVKTNR
jgi:ribonuclease Z